MSAERDEQWQEDTRQHLATARAFVDAASKLDPDNWVRPVGAGKWSPAELTEHLKLVYEGSLRELRDGTGIKICSGWLLQLKAKGGDVLAFERQADGTVIVRKSTAAERKSPVKSSVSKRGASK